MEKAKAYLNPFHEEIRKCTSCGFCQAACPVFGATLRPAYNTRGKMLILKEIMDGLIEPSSDLADIFYTCTTCRACTESCPRRIKAAEIVEGARRGFYTQGFAPGELKGIRENIFKTGNIFASEREERLDVYPVFLKERIQKGMLPERAETLIFFGCLPGYLDMKTVPSLVKTLEGARVNYTTMAVEEHCCGFPLYLMGADEFEPHAERLIKKINATGARELVTPCAGCYRTFTKLYSKIGDLNLHVYHAVQYLDRLIGEGRLKVRKESGERRVTYHDPCDLGRACGIFEEPRNILKTIAGSSFIEMTRNRLEARCCGGGGSLQVYHPELAWKMAAQRLRDALAVGANMVVTACPACKDNLRKGIRLIPKEARGEIKIMDINEVVGEAMDSGIS
jgi:Fe-S oxidoreductase